MWSKSDGKAQVSVGSRAPGGSPRVIAPWLRHGAVGRLGGCWGGSGAYGLGVRVPESRYGAPGLWRGACLRAGLRGRSGAGRRVGLGYVEKGFPSRLYGSVPVPKIKRAGNLTERLTPHLPDRLTRYLTVELTKAGIRELRVGARGVRTRLEGSCGAGSRPRPAPS